MIEYSYNNAPIQKTLTAGSSSSFSPASILWLFWKLVRILWFYENGNDYCRWSWECSSFLGISIGLCDNRCNHLCGQWLEFNGRCTRQPGFQRPQQIGHLIDEWTRQILFHELACFLVFMSSLYGNMILIGFVFLFFLEENKSMAPEFVILFTLWLKSLQLSIFYFVAAAI